MPIIDFPGGGDRERIRRPPCNVEAEQALLGCLLYDSAAFERLNDGLRGEHFYEPFHQRLFQAVEALTRKGQLAEPILIARQFETDPAFLELGGIAYLASLVDRAPPAVNARDYERVVYDLAIRRELVRVSSEVGTAAEDPENTESARELIEHAEQKLYALAETGGQSRGFVPFSEALHGAIAMTAEAHGRSGGLAGLSTGLVDLDRMIGGFHKSDLIVIAARPSMGKTALAANIAFNVARNYAYEPQPDGTRKTVSGGVVGFFQLEMSPEQLALRLLSDASGVSGDRLRKGEITAAEFADIRDAALQIENAPLYIDATGGISMAKLTARARRLKRTVGLDMLLVDYLQLVTVGEGSRIENRVQEVTFITQSLKALAKELNIPVVAMAQLSRQVEAREDKRPQLSDLRESGSIEQDADIVMSIYRESYYLSRTEPRVGTEEHFKWQERMDEVTGVAELIIGKQRHGPIGTVRLSYDENTTKFGNLASESRLAHN